MTLEQKLGLAAVVVAALGAIAIFFVPEVRRFLHLELRGANDDKAMASLITSVPAPVAVKTTPAVKSVNIAKSPASFDLAEKANIAATNIRQPDVALAPLIAASSHRVFEDSSDLRKSHGVTLIRVAESELSVPEMPTSSFAFVGVPHLTNYSRIPHKVPIQRVQDSYSLEIHKLQDGGVEAVCFVGPETLLRIRAGLKKNDKLTFFCSPWDEAPHVVCLSLDTIEMVRYRTIQINDDRLAALDCVVK